MTAFVGHDAAETALLSAFQAGRLHHAWLLAGPEGLGKANFARRAASHFLSRDPAFHCDHFDPVSEGMASRLLDNDQHPDCHVITLGPRDDKEERKKARGEPYDMARNIKIDQIRALQRQLSVRPSLAARRVIIFDSVDLLERGAANALLKTLEEPPADTILLLVAHNPARLLPTIRSRCQMLQFAPLSEDQLIAVLQAEKPGLSAAEYGALVRLGQGSPGQALAFAGIGMADIDRLLGQIVRDGDSDHRVRVQLSGLVAGKGQKERFSALLRYAPRLAAAQIRQIQDDRLPGAIQAWKDIGELASRSVLLNLDPQAVAFQIGGLLARLAPPR